MATVTARQRPITVAIVAMGGEGGGVLADWIAEVARAHHWSAQTTSVAGVAQRTGATIYYVELFPSAAGGGVRAHPVLSTMPTPGEVDLVIASELMEAGRAVQRGLVTPDRTTLIASTNRVYSIAEKSGAGDARVDSAALLAGAKEAARHLIAADFMKAATDAGSVISASLLGALAESGALPFERADFEAAITTFGKGVKPSLAAFDAGFNLAQSAEKPGRTFLTLGRVRREATGMEVPADAAERELAAINPRALLGPALADLADCVAANVPPGAQLMTLRGISRVAVYQDPAYAVDYLDRVCAIAVCETDAASAELTTEVARYAALWMTYQDTIHVAFQKVRRARLAGVRAELGAARAHPVHVREYLHPQVAEITDTLPVRLGSLLRRSKTFARLVNLVAKKGIVVTTTSMWGYTVLSTLARLRPLRRRSLRFAHEQDEIDRWLHRVAEIAAIDYQLACQVAQLPRLLKGYGQTWERGEEHFHRLLAQSESLAGRTDAATTLAAQMNQALA